MAGDEEITRRLADALAAGDQDEVTRIEAEVDRLDAARLARLTAPDALTNAARWYASNGIAVFPLKTGEKRPGTAHGFKDATTDLTTITTWWADTPQANIGLPTGLRFDVVDIDPPDGFTSLGELKAEGLIPEPLAYAHTPRGGMHIYVPPSGMGNGAGVLPGIDLRGQGGYVVAPPSRTDTGMWIWSTPLDPAQLSAVTK